MRSRSGLKLVLLAGAILGLIALLFVLSLDVLRRLNALETAGNDNLQWNLSQLEVEFLQFQNAGLENDRARMMRRFDVFYSRVGIFLNSPLYTDLRLDQDFMQMLEHVREFRDETARIIDTSNDLESEIPGIMSASQALHGEIRQLGLIGVSRFAEASDLNRRNLSWTLLRLGIFAALLVLGLVTALILLWRLLLQGRQHAEEITLARDRALAGEKAKADLIAVMSHEMRTPLNGLLGTMDLIGRTELNDKQRGYLSLMNSSGQLLLHHVDDVLELSRLDAGHANHVSEVFDAEIVVRDVIETVRNQAEAFGNSISYDIEASGLSSVRGDARFLKQMLLNLVGNAVKFTQNGDISLRARRKDGKDKVEFLITDTGIGIGKEDQARIFEEFVTLDPSYSRQAQGTGLGLAITRRLAKAAGGSIEVESDLGMGSSFRLKLPLPQADECERIEDESGLAEVDPMLGGCKVLIVEDNPINRQVAREMLDRLDCEIREAENGAQGVSIAQAEAFDLIFMDISMPQLDGVEATRQIRANPGPSQNARIVALTAHALPEEVARFEAAGMNDVIVKPVRFELLRSTLRSMPQTTEFDQGPIDWDVWRELVEVLGPDTAGETARQVIAEAEAMLDWVQNDAEVSETEKIVSKAHALAGSAALVGARNINQILLDFEIQCQADDLTAFPLPELKYETCRYKRMLGS